MKNKSKQARPASFILDRIVEERRNSHVFGDGKRNMATFFHHKRGDIH
jgi:hypothetical protein